MQEIEACKQTITEQDSVNLHLKFVENTTFRNRRRRGEKESNVDEKELRGLCLLRN